MLPNDPKFWDRQVSANSVDPDQTAPRAEFSSGSILLVIQSASLGAIHSFKAEPLTEEEIRCVFDDI